MRAPILVVFHAVSVVFSIFVNLPTKLMDLGILKCHPDFLRTNIGKWERFFRKIKSIFYVKQKTFEELFITSAQPCSQGLSRLFSTTMEAEKRDPGNEVDFSVLQRRIVRTSHMRSHFSALFNMSSIHSRHQSLGSYGCA